MCVLDEKVSRVAFTERQYGNKKRRNAIETAHIVRATKWQMIPGQQLIRVQSLRISLIFIVFHWGDYPVTC